MFSGLLFCVRSLFGEDWGSRQLRDCKRASATLIVLKMWLADETWYESFGRRQKCTMSNLGQNRQNNMIWEKM